MERQAVDIRLYFPVFVGGVMTIVSPSSLSVWPFVFSRSDQLFRGSGQPLLLGMAATFAVVAGLGTFAGARMVGANQAGRILAIAIFTLLGAAPLFPSAAEYPARPLVPLGGRVQGQNRTETPGIGRSPVLEMSTGLVWVPCPG